MALCKLNLDTAANEPYTPSIDRLMRERPMPTLKALVLTKAGNVVAPQAR